MSLARALLDELGPEDLAELAERLKPFLAGGIRGWGRLPRRLAPG